MGFKKKAKSRKKRKGINCGLKDLTKIQRKKVKDICKRKGKNSKDCKKAKKRYC